MSPTTPRRHTAARLLAATAAAVAVALGGGLGPAAAATNGPMPQTREHVLLAVPTVPTASTGGDVCTDRTNCPKPADDGARMLYLPFDGIDGSITGGGGGGGGGGEICSDWTNEDGSEGTNCPQGGGGAIIHGGDFLLWIDGIPGE